MEILQKALDSKVLIIALAGPYGASQHYTNKYIPIEMRKLYSEIPTKDVRAILEWKKTEIEKFYNKKCVWRINLPASRIDVFPKEGMNYCIRAISSKNKIIDTAKRVIAEGASFYVIFVNSGKATIGKPPVADRVESTEGSYALDISIEATEAGDSIILDNLEIIPLGYTINFFNYALYDPEILFSKPIAFHLGRGYNLSLVQKGNTFHDVYKYKDINKYQKMEVVGVAKLACPWCGYATGNRLQKEIDDTVRVKQGRSGIKYVYKHYTEFN